MRRGGIYASLLVVLVAAGVGAVAWINHAPGAAASASANDGATHGLRMFTTSRALPPLTFRDARDESRSLSDFRGRTLVVNLWATWCVPCRREMPSLDHLQQELGGRRFTVVAISQDASGMTAVNAFYRASHIQHLQRFVDVNGQDAQALHAAGLPISLVVDSQGREVGYALGAQRWDDPAMVQELRRVAGLPLPNASEPQGNNRMEVRG